MVLSDIRLALAIRGDGGLCCRGAVLVQQKRENGPIRLRTRDPRHRADTCAPRGYSTETRNHRTRKRIAKYRNEKNKVQPLERNYSNSYNFNLAIFSVHLIAGLRDRLWASFFGLCPLLPEPANARTAFESY